MASFFIRHKQSSKFVHPNSGTNPPNKDPLVVWNGGVGENKIQHQFVAVPGEGHFGYIEHMQTKRIVHPESGLNAPNNGTKVVYHSDRHVGALFMYDSVRKLFVHKGGKNWHPNSGQIYPNDGTEVVLWDGEHEGAQFEPVDSSSGLIDIYPTPTISGSWKMINAVIDPIAEHTKTISYTVGKSISSSTTTEHSWSVSAGISKKWFEGSSEYSGYVEQSSEETWEESITVEYTIMISAGQSVVTWQWKFAAEQYGDGLIFSSTILRDTDSLETPPSL